MDLLFIKTFGALGENKFIVPLESLITLCTYKYVIKYGTNVTLNLVHETKHSDTEAGFILNLSELEYKTNAIETNEIVGLCELPMMLVNKRVIISGICSVARQIIKSTLKINDNKCLERLLGFRNACLIACNEVSIWTKFCEIDVPETIKNLKIKYESIADIKTTEVCIPNDVLRFEKHLSQPVRMHNVYKVAREQMIEKQLMDTLSELKIANQQENLNKNIKKVGLEKIGKPRKSKSRNGSIDSSTPIEQLNLEHTYSEGPFLSLADIILISQFKIFFEYFGTESLQEVIPLTMNWYKMMTENPDISDSLNIIVRNKKMFTSITKYIINMVDDQSLYKSDPKRYKPRNRIFTKQNDIVTALKITETLSYNIPEETFGCDLNFDWSIIPPEASPFGGSLPSSRAKRKCEQLENLAKAVIKLAKPGDTIVDFCSGSGHLGILLALVLQKCNIILLENKEESLERAKVRVEKLNLNNVKLLQCNLDYFRGNFNLGVSLHACGVATDLVIQQCLAKVANFVCCPCCYGGVHNCHHLTYPRSKAFKKSDLTLKDYLVLGHSADQTHDVGNAKTVQGEKCMQIIDTDRLLQAMEYNYEVRLGKLKPPSCTPKNNLLVGWLK